MIDTAQDLILEEHPKPEEIITTQIDYTAQLDEDDCDDFDEDDYEDFDWED